MWSPCSPRGCLFSGRIEIRSIEDFYEYDIMIRIEVVLSSRRVVDGKLESERE